MSMRLPLALALLLLSSPAFCAYEMEDIQKITFEIKDPKTGEVYYSGKEDITAVDAKNVKRETHYFDTTGKEVQTESVTFDKETLKTSDYSYKNLLTGEESSVQGTDSEVKMSYKENADKKAKDTSFKPERNTFHGKVINYLILRNWKALNSSKIYKFILMLPSRLDTIAFQIVHRKSYQKDGEQREVFALIPQNVLIRTLAPHLEFEFSGGEKPLAKQILCPSPLPVKGQKDKMVYYVFSYPEKK